MFKSMGSAAKQRGLHSSLLDGGPDSSQVIDSSSTYAHTVGYTPRAIREPAERGPIDSAPTRGDLHDSVRASSAYDNLESRYLSWVCVTGFPITDDAAINTILIKFQQFDMESCTRGTGNWLFIKLTTPRQAADAVALDGAFLSDATVLSVRRLSKQLADKLGFQPEGGAATGDISSSGRQAQQFRQHLRPGDVSEYLQAPGGGFAYLQKNRGSQISICVLLCAVLLSMLMFELKAFYSLPATSGFVVDGTRARSAVEMVEFGPSQSKYVYSTRYNSHSSAQPVEQRNQQGKGVSGLKINFNVTLYSLPCESAAVEAMGSLGGAAEVRKWPVDARGVRRQYPDYKSDGPAGARIDFPGCLLAGSVQYPESAARDLVATGGAFRIISTAPDTAERPIQLSHVINSLSFGNALSTTATERVRALPRGFVSSPLAITAKAFTKGSVEHQVTIVATTLEVGRHKGPTAIKIFQLEHSSTVGREAGQLRFGYSVSPLEIGIEQSSKPYSDVVGGALLSTGGTLCILLLLAAVVNFLFKPKFFDLFNLSY